MTAIRARSVRVVRRGQAKRAARITFTLNAPGRVVFVVRGPAPSCQVAARFRVRGRRGANEVRFTGRVGRRNLPQGTYRITARAPGRAPSRPIVVVIGESGDRDAFACSRAAAAVEIASGLGTFDNGSGGSNGSSVSAAGRAPDEGQAAKPKKDGGVLPAVSNRLRELPGALPRPSIPSASSPHRVIGLAALALLILSGLALVVYVLRFIRGPHTT